MLKKAIITAIVIASTFCAAGSLAQSKRHYKNRFSLMLDYAVRTNEYVRRHLEDKNLTEYAHAMADVNASSAEQMTPPKMYADLHPHFLLVLANIERSFYYASQRRFDRYRHYQKELRKELHLLESIANQKHLDLYMFNRGW